MSVRDKYNSSGCLDMTAYIAIRRIERKEQFERMATKLKMNKKSKQGKNNTVRVQRKG